jgi:hypothetical protein
MKFLKPVIRLILILLMLFQLILAERGNRNGLRFCSKHIDVNQNDYTKRI